MALALVCRRLVAVAAVSIAGCCNSDSAKEPQPSALEPGAQQAEAVTIADLVDDVSRCDVFHRGAFVDLGSDADQGRYGFSLQPPQDVKSVTREGADWAQVVGRSVSITVVLDRPGPVFVEARLRGQHARSATVRLDNKVIGSVRLAREEARIVRSAITKDDVPAGQHELTLQFHGMRRDQVAADIDWVRVGYPDDDPSTYAAPVLRDLRTSATIGGKPRKALAIRAPASIQCMVAPRKRSVLRAVLGYVGPGVGEVHVRLHEPGRPPLVVHTARVEANAEQAPTVEASLDGFAGRFIGVELVAAQSSPGGRVLLGDPVVTVPASTASAQSRARVVVVVVLSSTSRDQIPPYQDVPALATLTDLASSSVTFHQHRTTTTVVAGSMASLLTGLSPTTHTVLDSGARLPQRFATVATLARDGRVATGMFTGNPYTFRAFGFDRGWDRYEMVSPVSGQSARAPMQQAVAWLEQRVQDPGERPIFLLVHARGTHPPWAASAEEIQNLPPPEYMGPVEPRRGGQVLARMRSSRRLRMTAEDRVRIEGLAEIALAAEDQVLGQLIEVLRKSRLWSSTLLVVTSDVAMGGYGRVPFGDGDKLGEDVLQVPLVVHFPDDRMAGSQVQSATTTVDLARTILSALELTPPDMMGGVDLLSVALEPGRYVMRTQAAVLPDSYAMRWGDVLLHGVSAKAPQLCRLGAMGACTEDLTEALPFAAAHLWRLTYAQYREPHRLLNPVPLREPAALDAQTSAALTVWGGQAPPESGKR